MVRLVLGILGGHDGRGGTGGGIAPTLGQDDLRIFTKLAESGHLLNFVDLPT
jgi:hypothetical protein